MRVYKIKDSSNLNHRLKSPRKISRENSQPVRFMSKYKISRRDAIGIAFLYTVSGIKLIKDSCLSHSEDNAISYWDNFKFVYKAAREGKLLKDL